MNSEYYSKPRVANFLAKSTPFYISTNNFPLIKRARNLYYVKYAVYAVSYVLCAQVGLLVPTGGNVLVLLHAQVTVALIKDGYTGGVLHGFAET